MSQKKKRNEKPDSPSNPQLPISQEQLQQYLPFIDQFMQQRYIAPLREEIDQVKEAVLEIAKKVGEYGQALKTISLTPQESGGNPTPTTPEQQGQLAFFTTIAQALGLGGGSKSFADKLKEYAEIKQAAEVISGGGLSTSDVIRMMLGSMNIALKLAKGSPIKEEEIEKVFEKPEHKGR